MGRNWQVPCQSETNYGVCELQVRELPFGGGNAMFLVVRWEVSFCCWFSLCLCALVLGGEGDLGPLRIVGGGCLRQLSYDGVRSGCSFWDPSWDWLIHSEHGGYQMLGPDMWAQELGTR